MKMSRITGLALAALVVAGCFGPKAGENGYVDAEGFTWTDGSRIAPEAPSEYYIIRFEVPDGTIKGGERTGHPKWKFVEIRQLKESVSVIEDGVYKPDVPWARWIRPTLRIPAVNWPKWLCAGSRNVRIRFVGPDYTVEKENLGSAPAGYVPIFNGKDLSGWRGVTTEEKFNKPTVRRAALPEKRREMQDKADRLMREHWFVKDGALYFDGQKGGYSIATARDYANFDMIVDWRLLRVCGDSGFYLRGMAQVQIWDPNLWGGLGSGGLYNNHVQISNPTSREDRPIGDWNRCRMRLVGDRLTVWLNGVKVVDGVRYENCDDRTNAIPLVDQIELQCHGDPVEFRNIFIRELPEAAEDIPDPAAAVRGERIDLLKDGLASWKASDPKLTMGWSVKDGVLSNYVTADPEKNSRGGSGGTHLVTTREDFLDFDLSYDVLVPAKCNSGVYLRGRYEIQVCDSFGRKVDCHNMAALYDLLTPAVAAEKPADTWQHVDLTLYRRHLTVTLNGVRIIDNRPVGGVTPGALDGDEFVAGPILLQGDHSNASFRNMILTKIVK